MKQNINEMTKKKKKLYYAHQDYMYLIKKKIVKTLIVWNIIYNLK